MSLNQEQLDDLEGETIVGDDNTITPPSILPQTKEELTIVPETKQLAGHAVELKEDFEKKLPTMDVSLKLVEENHSKIVDLEDVEQNILGDGKISQDGAEEVNAAAEGLFDGPITKSQFTAVPSGVNFQHVKKHMRARIALESAALVSNFKALIDQPIEDAKRMVAELQNDYLVFIRGEASYLAEQAVNLPERIASSQNMMVRIGQDFQNLSTLDLTNIPGDLNVNGAPRFDLLVGALKKVLSDNNLKAFVLAVGSGVDPAQASSCGHVLHFQTAAVTIKDLINFYRNSSVVDYIDDLGTFATNALQTLESIQTEGQGLQDNPEAVREYLTKNAARLTGASETNAFLVRRILDMKYLNFLTGELFDFFGKQ
jgi:hypothetical protein